MRSDAREAAFKIVYSMQFNRECTPSFRQSVYKNYPLKEEEIAYAERIFQAVCEHEQELLTRLQELVKSYSLSRLFAADKSILLIAMAEILYFEDIPNVVSVNEAAGLAKKFSAETSADFVNGVLATLIN